VFYIVETCQGTLLQIKIDSVLIIHLYFNNLLCEIKHRAKKLLKQFNRGFLTISPRLKSRVNVTVFSHNNRFNGFKIHFTQ